jgi:hypothetical protein
MISSKHQSLLINMINPLIKKCPVLFSGATVDSLYLVTFVYWIQVTAWPQFQQTDKKSNLSTPQRDLVRMVMKYSDNLFGGLPKKMCKKLFWLLGRGPLPLLRCGPAIYIPLSRLGSRGSGPRRGASFAPAEQLRNPFQCARMRIPSF